MTVILSIVVLICLGLFSAAILSEKVACLMNIVAIPLMLLLLFVADKTLDEVLSRKEKSESMNKKLLIGITKNIAVNTLDFVLMCMGMMLMHVLVMHSGADCGALLWVGIIGYAGYVILWTVSYLNGEKRGGCCCGKHEKESR